MPNVNVDTYKTLKKNVLAILSNMEKFVSKYPKAELPAPGSEYKVAKEILEKSEFNIVVCGKVKNGKSSMINALIGRNLLPVNSDVATSLAFQISNSQKDEFHVVYANGDRKEIKEEDLAKYGSQTEIDDNGLVDVSKSISYIEVKTPIKFLPEGVTITDTPGIGSTYPHHTAITKQQLKFADAVIYVMNPSPLETIEIDFIKDIAEITPSIMFVMTKVDNENEEAIDQNIKGNKNHIQNAVGKIIGEKFDIFPMSSLQLMSSAQSDNQEDADFNYCISGFEEVKEAMQMLVYKTVGYYRAGSAFNAAIDYYTAVNQSLCNRKNAIVSAVNHYNELVEQYTTASKAFSERMGEKKRSEVMSSIDEIIKISGQDFNKIFSSQGDVYSIFEKEIDALSLDETTQYSDTLGDRVVEKVQTCWSNLTKIVFIKMQEKISEYNEECKLAAPSSLSISVDEELKNSLDISGLSGQERISGMRSEMFMASAVTGAIGTVASAAYFFAPALITPALPVIAPVMVVLSLGTVLWGAISGSQKAKRQKLAQNQSQMKKYVQSVLSNCQKQLVETSLADNKYKSLYQGFIEAIREQAQKSLKEIYDKYYKEIEAMKTTITESKQNPKLIEALDFMITEWQKNKESLKVTRDELENIQKTL